MPARAPSDACTRILALTRDAARRPTGLVMVVPKDSRAVPTQAAPSRRIENVRHRRDEKNGLGRVGVVACVAGGGERVEEKDGRRSES